MDPAGRQRALLFIAVVLAVYLFAALYLIRSAIARFRGLRPRASRWETWARRVIFTLAGIGLLCFAYGYFVEPYWPEVTRVRLVSDKVKGTRPIRIAHVSDIHSDPKKRLEDRLPALIGAERPDVIVFTGDSVNSPEGLPVFKQCLSALSAIAPTLVVKGNWDAWYWEDLPLFSGTGAKELDGTGTLLRVGESDLWIGGVAVTGEAKLSSLLESAPPQAVQVILYHSPDLIYDVARYNIDLYLAGHTHGGQVALPFYGALITFSEFGKRFEAGLHQVGVTSLYVNRGIGMEGGPAPRVRFLARPEITIIEIRPRL
ncbi:MAG: metallophosphoesterase [Deltaproteobacteria bacterium]|nr:metallophosphoesterase [Deltaproteobacteria bacterium]